MKLTVVRTQFGTDATITVSWEQGLAVVSVPTKGKITEEDFESVNTKKIDMTNHKPIIKKRW